MTDINNDITVYKNRIEECIYMFFDGLTDNEIRNTSMSVWNCCLINIYNTLFKHQKEHKEDKKRTNIDIYNISLVSELFDIYNYYSMYFCKEVSLYGFMLFTGFNRRDFIDIYYTRLASHKNNDLRENLNEARHESLKSLLLQGGKTQFGATVILNHDYDYNLPGSNRDVVERRQLNKGEIASQLGITLDSNELLTDSNDN